MRGAIGACGTGAAAPGAAGAFDGIGGGTGTEALAALGSDLGGSGAPAPADGARDGMAGGRGSAFFT